MLILIDNGHGCDTPGKRSPDSRLLEWRYARDIAQRVVTLLVNSGFDAQLLVPEDNDVPLSDRVYRVNNECFMRGKRNVVVVSIHVNASHGTYGQWHDARGFSVFVSKNASVPSRSLAKTFTLLAEDRGLIGNRWVPGSKVWEQNLAICRNTQCPAVLTENLFMDNRADVEFLLSDEGRAAIAQLHHDAIMAYAAKWG